MVRFCKSQTSLVGKTAIVTGANAGLGYETALDFAKRGGRVILACRNVKTAKEACEKIVNITGNGNVVVKALNLETLTSVREFALDINSTEDRLNILVNNAGAADLPQKYTEDGLLLEMAVNYFSPFLLTHLLLDLLKRSIPSRIVNVASIAAEGYLFPFIIDDINKTELMVYAKTKLCNIYFTQELARKLEGTGVTTYSVHPGIVNTKFFYKFSDVLGVLVDKLFRTSEEGAQTQIYVSVENEIEHLSGRHFEDCKAVPDYFTARSGMVRRALWDKTEELVGIKREKVKIYRNSELNFQL